MHFKIIVYAFTMGLILLSLAMNAQQFSVHFAGQANYYSKTIVPIVNQEGRNFTNTQYVGLKYDHAFKGDNLYISMFYSRFDAWVGFTVSDPSFGFGSSSGYLNRVGFSAGWNLFKNSRFKLIPNASFIVQFPPKSYSYGLTVRGGLDPDLHTPFVGTRYLDAFNTTSILLGPGLDFIYNPWWRLNLVFSSYYSFGFAPYAKFYLEYTYKGIPQPRGEWSADGTGFFYSVGAGFKLGKLEKKQEKKKSKRGKKKR